MVGRVAVQRDINGLEAPVQQFRMTVDQRSVCDDPEFESRVGKISCQTIERFVEKRFAPP